MTLVFWGVFFDEGNPTQSENKTRTLKRQTNNQKLQEFWYKKLILFNHTMDFRPNSAQYGRRVWGHMFIHGVKGDPRRPISLSVLRGQEQAANPREVETSPSSFDFGGKVQKKLYGTAAGFQSQSDKQLNISLVVSDLCNHARLEAPG